ncbi:MAG: NrdH-redoxin [Candidatus Liptonbacteria bacterium CG11_big_fil_rev_8_21_14_0_20_35_14]|uniref:NrdH-redoxin n=1 Tax=Candidatus Liptonbacteria bacterium CG11_big_fil_rev_8_21_14_0_20_35_14 TaxID=1974634 RepID=A0A2H0N8B5_9BACT|nr:MAG: NrdH-redoxin [Candidatus Liptonbacteria bacterium CG11_big_fil_rev_8_21_14_0_20_35_14]
MSVKIYSTPTCSFCKMTKEFLKENNIEYTDVNVAVDHIAAKEMVTKTGQMGVPVTIITNDKGEEEVVIGFNEGKFKELLEIK